MNLKNMIQGIAHRFNYEIRRKSSYFDAFALQKRIVTNPAPVIFDVGAHIGGTVTTYRGLFPQASIYAFEPHPQSFQQLKATMVGDLLASAHNVAVSDKTGPVTFHVNAFTATNSILPTDARSSVYWGSRNIATAKKIEVRAVTVDGFCSANAVPKIDILKLDIQGHEFAALLGAREMLAKQDISLIYTEIIMVPAYEGQRKLHEYLVLLDSYGYELVDLFDIFRAHRRIIQADLVFASRSLVRQMEKSS